MEMKNRYRMKTIWMLVLLVVLLCQPVPVLADADYRIEQVNVNMPDVTVYYRAPQAENPEGYLGGEALRLESNTLFSECGEAAEYYVLLDISGSIQKTRFQEIKTSLTQFRQEMRNEDRMILLSFGNEVTMLLNGSEGAEESANVIGQLDNRDNNTVLFDAIDQVTDMISKEAASSQKRRVVVIISDGKDCADNTRNMDSVEKRLIAKGIPVFTVAVENNEGDSELEIADYSGKFAALSRNTGGVPWACSQSQGVLEGLNKIRETVLGSYRALLRAKTNNISNQNEDFVLKFPEGKASDTVSILVDRGQKDDTAPTAKAETGNETNEIRIVYSEAMRNAENAESYTVKNGEKTLAVQQVTTDDAGDDSVLLVFGDTLYDGTYEISIRNVTDASYEKNPLGISSLTLEITDRPAPEPEKESLGQLILKWWPIGLTVLILIIVIISILIMRKMKKDVRKMEADIENLEQQAQIQLTPGGGIVLDSSYASQAVSVKNSNLPTRKVILWLSNGVSEPKRLDWIINGSTIVGRSSKMCEIYCDDSRMSRQHFALELDGDNIFVCDLDSRNGTIVNGISIMGKGRFRLQPHDEIVAGGIHFRIDWK